MGDGGAAFDPRYARGTTFDAQSGGMVVAIDPEQNTDLWLVNTAESNVTRWDPSPLHQNPWAHIGLATRWRMSGHLLLG